VRLTAPVFFRPCKWALLDLNQRLPPCDKEQAMKTVTADELKEILRLHKLWIIGDPQGKRADLRSANLRLADLSSADLSSADLSSASLSSANLSSANLSSANLSSADLSSADLSLADLSSADLSSAKNVGDMILNTGEKFSDYLKTVVPALLTGGGKTIQQIVESKAWECHSWENCPMATAFGVHQESECPLLLQPRVRQFVQLYDAGLIPCPEV
jgi:hypothetical protein